MRCDELVEDKAAVLYGEADAEAQRRVAEHGATCPACRDELADLRGVRRDLTAWKLPAALRPRRPWRRASVFPGWVLPAAAALLVAVGSGWATWRSEERYAAVAQRLSEQEHRHRQELASLRAELDQALAAPRAVAASGGDGDLLAQVQELIAASEGRQRAVLRAGFDLLEQRREYDMARVKAGFSYLEGRSGRDMANAMKMVNYVLASQPGVPAATAQPR
jgi:hypothetical protein